MTWDASQQVVIAGVGYSTLTRQSDRLLGDLTVDAVDAALEHAGIDRRSIQGLATSPAMPRYGGEKGNLDGVEVVTPYYLGERLGIRDRLEWTSQTQHMVTYSLIDAVTAIASGFIDTAVVYRSLFVPQGSYVNFDTSMAAGDDQFRAPFGFSSPPAWAATVTQRYFHVHGGGREAMAAYLAQNRSHARLNPVAYWRDKPLTTQQALDARMVADPVTILDCDIPVTGAIALVLTRASIVTSQGKPAAGIRAMATTATAGQPAIPMTLEAMRDSMRGMTERLYRHAGLTPQDMHTAQLYDGFSILAPVWAEGAGLVAEGEGLHYLSGPDATFGGRLPVNTGGGALGEGRLHGLTQIAEAALQTMNAAGDRQVPDSLHSLATVSNGMAGSTAFIFSRVE